MQKLAFEVTPSFLCNVIRKSGNLKNDLEVIAAFEKLALIEEPVLDQQHADIIDDKGAERKLLFDNIDPKLLPLAEDLYGLIEVEEPDHDREEDS